MFTNDLLQGKRILITGGGTGIGRAMAERFLQLGATVFICGRRLEVVQKTAAELSASTGGTIEGFSCDVRYPEDVEALIEQLWAKGPLDVLVNNAAGNFLARTEELSLTRLRRRYRHRAQRHHQHDHGLWAPLAGR